ncbi:HAD-IA family hydrolase [Paenibacillus sp. J5C_2022]|uniref:HAD family hydrolase n=1 Tax=Paenibacillus sp. J5C2022 TaxID=2977129 RepID=UPI0021D08524|nr:HAD family hydrolase [Paenibacillus sp. J5C2022]MCU6710126.1 HAD-IA family hydrolase [Paenibacillus sp. J5C2022]
MRKSFVWFDLGYTLVYQERESTYQTALKQFGLNKELNEIERAYHYADKLFMREYPGVLGGAAASFVPWYLGVVNYRMNIQLDLYRLASAIREQMKNNKTHWQAFPCTHSTLERLMEQSVGIGLISNWDNSARQVLEENGLTDYFDRIVISSETGYEKPDPRIFHHAMQLAGVSASECLYVGDNYYDDVIGARAVMMDCLLINRFGRFGIEEVSDAEIIFSVAEVPAQVEAKKDSQSSGMLV